MGIFFYGDEKDDCAILINKQNTCSGFLHLFPMQQRLVVSRLDLPYHLLLMQATE